MSKNSLQSDFITKVKQAIPANVSLVEELAELLEVSNDSAYRRIRGETSLTLDEIAKICSHYKLSFDTFNTNNEGSVTFHYQPLNTKEENFESYLTNILNDLKKIESFSNKQIIFAAEDIPVFHHFKYPELTAFKIFYWNKSILNNKSFEGKKFDKNFIDRKLLNIAEEILKTYINIPCIEVWSDDTVNSTLKQIEFYWDSGQFQSKEDAMLICELFEKQLQHIQKQAERSTKFWDETKIINDENFTLYSSELMIGNNCVLATMGDNKAAYLSHHTFNSMITNNGLFCSDTESWLKNLMKKSTLISGVAEKQRYQFFKKIFENISLLRSKIGA